ncbi:glycoside hydrolase family 30 protein [Fundicoccus culcitae]|uniref:Glycosyl hydrolase n=1 Tax=Fundicoccus culcitae TaxID=2969821 RepID=A0ABY5P355_9LACT|nr:glycoside hydrolase family 30 beta sandwich domain-containing protein [Fundicoccus culcitae]UUX33158.1 glycosyl hydrolase [Fundicoccus culcitae]
MTHVNVAITSDESGFFQPLATQTIPKKPSQPIQINTTKTFQRMDGFGASFTDSAAYLIDQVLSASKRDQVMTSLFDAEEGINLTLVRNPMGASDYARTIYSYNDLKAGETDLDQTEFSVMYDEESIIPLSQQALALNPSVKFMASPWSAPAWMKTSASMKGGQLREAFYASYALYFVKYVQAYADHGLPIYAVTPQNEPLYEPLHYPSMLMTAAEQVVFVRDYLKPAFVEAGLATKILGYDHNWDRIDYPIELLDNAYDDFDGIAWHWYGGRAISQSRVAAMFPDKEIHFTEGSGGEWIPAFEPAFSNLLRTGMDILRNGSQSLILWNMALDEKNGPTVPGFGNSTCRGLVTINQSTGTYEFTLDYYGLGHFSKYLQPSAVRVDSQSADGILSVAFINPDASLVAVVFNDTDQEKHCTLEVANAGDTVAFDLNPHAAATLLLNK